MAVYDVSCEGREPRRYTTFEDAVRVMTSVVELGAKSGITIVGEARDMLVRLNEHALEKNIHFSHDPSGSDPAALEYVKMTLVGASVGGTLGGAVGFTLGALVTAGSGSTASAGTIAAAGAELGAKLGLAAGPKGILFGTLAGVLIGGAIGAAVGAASVKLGVRVRFVAIPADAANPPGIQAKGVPPGKALSLEFLPAA